ncbi:MAG: cation-translocating P-type ATPase [Chloroflexota bacterium]|nr:cation-translocating P-type ATPase [Chloroflexota bacterium]MDE2841650.1 cation-translocating P-type ATPase [Chloroflexota bacterium]MDE2931150.1 cation-translocating P-type ATPase [Chloroflexota bacterium]
MPLTDHFRTYGPVLRSSHFRTVAATGVLIVAAWLVSFTGEGGDGQHLHLGQSVTISLVPAGESYIAVGLALAAVGIGGLGIVWGALQGLRQRQVNVDELVSIAVIASVLLGEYLSAGLVVFMMIFGQLLEEATSQRATAALEHLAALQPDRARRVLQGDEIEEIDANALRPGDTVLVRPGERLPVDGVVIAGTAAVDETLVTGESLPVHKEPGHRAYAGTLSQDGALTIRAVAVGENAYVGQIGRLLDTLEKERAPIVRVADRYAKYFTPAILLVSSGTWLISGNLSAALAVLIIACPCALVLATPTAIVAGVANAARQGILIKGGARFEAAGAVDTVAVDKTGTLTLGTPVVQGVIPMGGVAAESLLTLAAAVERYSEHPLGKALVAHAARQSLDLPAAADFRAFPGRGVEAQVARQHVLVGTRDLIETEGVTGLPPQEKAPQEGSLMLVAVDGRFWGWIQFADTVRPGASQAVEHLHALGIERVVMLTGDRPQEAQRLAAAVGIDAWQARLLPEHKVDWIRGARDEGKRVAMAGDGVNDAPALASADLGIVMGGTGTAVAAETADIALMRGDIGQLPTAIAISQMTLRGIKQNLLFALVWNLVGIALAATGVLGPITAALAHNLGSVAVVVNAARYIAAPSKLPPHVHQERIKQQPDAVSDPV